MGGGCDHPVDAEQRGDRRSRIRQEDKKMQMYDTDSPSPRRQHDQNVQAWMRAAAYAAGTELDEALFVLAEPGNVEVHLDSATGTMLGSCTAPVTGDWQMWSTQTCPLSAATGTHDVYLVFTGGADAGGYLFNLDWFAFRP